MPARRRQTTLLDFGSKGERMAQNPKRQDGGARDHSAPAAPVLSEPPPRPVADTAVAAVREMQRLLGELDGALSVLSERVEASCASTLALEKRVMEAETRISTLEDQVSPLLSQNAALQVQVRDLHRRAEDQEGRGRRHNVRILGVPEGLTNRKSEMRMEAVIRQALPTAKLSALFIIERAHRSLQQQPPPGAPPRPMICRILNFRDRDAILASAREAGEIHWEGNKLSFFPDFTPEVQQNRRKFNEVKKMLQDRETRYAMLFPARLRIQHGGKTHFFVDPSRAAEFVEHNIPARSPRGSSSTDAGSRRGISPSRFVNTPLPRMETLEPARDPEITRLASVIDAWMDHRLRLVSPDSPTTLAPAPNSLLSDND